MSVRSFVFITFGLLAFVLAVGAAGAIIGGRTWDHVQSYEWVALPPVLLFAGFAVGTMLWHIRK